MAAGQSKKSKKHGRNKDWCNAYRSSARREGRDVGAKWGAV